MVIKSNGPPSKHFGEPVISKIIDEHKETLEDHENSPRDLVDMLLLHQRNNKGHTAEEVLGKLDIEVAVGDLLGEFPALANMMIWGLWIPATEPEDQEKLREECENIVSSDVPTASSKKDLVYGEAVMYEVLRLVSSPIIPHVANENTDIQGFRVPKDTIVMFNTCDLNFEDRGWTRSKVTMEVEPQFLFERRK
ncbi:cytochrome P450 2U1-like [Galendromus occidentalis]|uniref:Cytochrome P450 2U1-like n=1 Tax=Galendromus occidentalis TaxID=34638 RepID=A0AAJ6QXS4_9ACAR|nr:cytochrome P450 2U1-like [Galendromus occidentalis]